MVAENVFLLETSSFSATFSETDATRVVRHGFFDAKSREATSGRPYYGHHNESNFSLDKLRTCHFMTV